MACFLNYSLLHSSAVIVNKTVINFLLVIVSIKGQSVDDFNVDCHIRKITQIYKEPP